MVLPVARPVVKPVWSMRTVVVKPASVIAIAIIEASLRVIPAAPGLRAAGRPISLAAVTVLPPAIAKTTGPIPKLTIPARALLRAIIAPIAASTLRPTSASATGAIVCPAVLPAILPAVAPLSAAAIITTRLPVALAAIAAA